MAQDVDRRKLEDLSLGKAILLLKLFDREIDMQTYLKEDDEVDDETASIMERYEKRFRLRPKKAKKELKKTWALLLRSSQPK